MSLIDLPRDPTVGAGVQVRLRAESLKASPGFPLEPAVQGRKSATAQVEGVRLLRQQLRQTRRQLSPAQRKSATAAIVQHLHRASWLRQARHVACYQAHDGEVDLSTLLAQLQRQGKRLWLPQVPPLARKRLTFVAYTAQNRWHRNRFGIREPMSRHRCPLRRLDVVLTPLVGYTATGRRLGMGGGFYDRTFAFRRWSHWRKPWLIGIGFACQQQASLPQMPWDVALDAWVNEQGVGAIMPRAAHAAATPH